MDLTSVIHLVKTGCSEDELLHGVSQAVDGKPLSSVSTHVNTTDEGGRTGLYWAARLGHAQLVPLLLRMGGDPSIPETETGNTPLMAAVIHNNILVVDELLSAHPNGLSHPSSSSSPPSSSSFSSDFVGLNTQRESDGKTPLHVAAEWGFSHIVLRLLEAGPDLDAVDGSGKKAHQVASNDDIASLIVASKSASFDSPRRKGSPGRTRATRMSPLLTGRVTMSLEDALLQEEVDEVNRFLLRELNAKPPSPFVAPLVTGDVNPKSRAELDVRLEALRASAAARREWIDAEISLASKSSDRIDALRASLRERQAKDNAVLADLGKQLDQLLASSSSGRSRRRSRSGSGRGKSYGVGRVHNGSWKEAEKVRARRVATPAYTAITPVASAAGLGRMGAGEVDLAITVSLRVEEADVHGSGFVNLASSSSSGAGIVVAGAETRVVWEFVTGGGRGGSGIYHVMGLFVRVDDGRMGGLESVPVSELAVSADDDSGLQDHTTTALAPVFPGPGRGLEPGSGPVDVVFVADVAFHTTHGASAPVFLRFEAPLSLQSAVERDGASAKVSASTVSHTYMVRTRGDGPFLEGVGMYGPT